MDFVSIIEIVEVCPNYDQYQAEYEIDSTNNHQKNVTTVSKLKVAPGTVNNYYNDSNRGSLCSDEEIASFDEAEKIEDDSSRGVFHGHGGGEQIKPCTIVSGWSCPKIGRYKHPTHCQKYVQCKFCGENSVYRCGHDESFDGKRCSSNWSTCGALKKCTFHRELLRDPWNKHGYFVCLQSKGFSKKHGIYRRECYDNYHFDVHRQKCVRLKWRNP